MNNLKKAVLVRAQQDEPTKHAYGWAEQVRQALENAGWRVHDCESAQALRACAEAQLAQGNSILFIFYGHGAEDCLLGQDKFCVIDMANVAMLQNCITYVVACSSTQQLGADAVKHGGQCYIGYNAEVVINYEFSDSLEKCVNSGMLAWIKNDSLSATEIIKIMRDVYDVWIDYYAFRGRASVDWAADLQHNRDALTLCGKEEICLKDL